ncbi:MAG: hypothetical protein RLY59_564 [Actinomycetota bacterium]
MAQGHCSARVAKWQTRWLQVPVPARAWGFKSPLAHEQTPGVMPGVLPLKTRISLEKIGSFSGRELKESS